MSIVYVDLDGVLADFELGLKQISGGRGLAEVGDEHLWDVVRPYADGFYANLPLMPDAEMMWHWLHQGPFEDIQILTAIPRRANFPTAERDKRIWVAKHFGEDVKVNIGPFAIDKQNYCKPGDLLIDDSELNIPQWRAKGGIGILHKSGFATVYEILALCNQGRLR